MCFCQEGRVGEFCESGTCFSSFSEIAFLKFDLISIIFSMATLNLMTHI